MDTGTVLVTGVQGFIGARLARRLLDGGYLVRGLVRREADIPNVELVHGDVADREAMDRAVAGVDAIVHCVADFGSDFGQAMRVNVEGTRNLVDAALGHGCRRFVHVSTCGVYNLVDVPVVDEDTPTWPLDQDSRLVYGVTKAEGERVVREAGARGLDFVILRPPNVLGPDLLNSWSYHIALRIQEGELAVAGTGDNTWPYVVVDNLLDAMLAALREPAAAGQTYTIVDGHTTWGAYAGIFAGWLGKELPTRERRAPYDMFRGRFSTDKARRELGYAPKVTFDQVMAETKGFLQDRGVLNAAR